MNPPKIIGTLTNKYGDPVQIHKTRHGLKRLREVTSPIIEYNRAIAPLVSARIKALRLKNGWTLLEMAKRMGWLTGNPKERAWAIENNTRGEGVRLGTLYRLAEEFGVNICELLPSLEEVSEATEPGNF